MSDHLSEETLNEYVDGMLPARIAAEVETHLTNCAECAARAESLRTLFSTLDQLPELVLERDFSKAVLRAVQPEIVLPARWRWAVWGQVGLTVLLVALSLPVLLQTEWFTGLHLSPLFLEPLAATGLFFNQLTQTITEMLTQWIQGIGTIQIPTLPFSLSVLTPILLATGLLWLVGNGLLLKKRI